MNDLHGILFAYRSDKELGELTRPRNTCSLAYGGRYRLIDFMLSSYVNAGISDVGVIVHEQYQSLLDHLGSGKDWELSRKHGGLRILPPFGYSGQGTRAYQGNVEALAGVSSYLRRIRQDYVIMGWGDTAVNLPVEEIYNQHIATGADITVVCTPALKGAPRFSSYVQTDAEGRITDLSVHPSATDNQLESLEVYVISKKLLIELVDYCASHEQFSFTRHLLQPRVKSLKIMAYTHTGYAGRFQSVADYFQRSMELLDPAVCADLFNDERPVRTKDMSNPSSYYGPESKVVRSLVSDGCHIEGEVENCVISRGVVIEKGAKVANSVLMQGTVVKAGASLNFVITDKDVVVNEDRSLMGHFNYPLAIAKGSVV